MKIKLKYLLDWLLALLLVIIFAPVFVVVILIIRIGDGRPVFFTQQRPGLREKPFRLLKFRTMKNLYDEKGELLADALRMTKLGHWLRRLSLDELPQLLNVLKGEMSLVGPRPLLMEYLPLYNARQRKRMDMKPGITGWAQVNGRNAISWEQRFELDVWYVENYSLWLDVKIMLLTVAKVFKQEGISQQGHVTVEKFTGTRDEK